ncbi:LamG-like jellyroll fold domain-containing protein [Ruminiclostridium josui]|uniref:LamG-like jellyroll fold domain-containing protein n=1 Tax=Ruminiclostridium josui TaxID=1499 RepID=UPI0004640541|nr:LamG-like jellyroll fold domain-containing protein [Ruminiclostridium josui]
MKKITKSILGFLAATILFIQVSPLSASAAINRHFAIKNTTKDVWYGVTADVTIPSTISGLGRGSAGYADWYIGMDPSSGTAVEAGISYSQGEFRVFLNTGNGNGAGVVDSSIKPGQKVNLKIRLSSDGKTASLYVNGALRKSESTVGKFTNGKGKAKIVIGVQDEGNASTSVATIDNVKLCANSAGTTYTTMTSSMGSYSTYNAGTTSKNPFTVSSTFPLKASLNSGY